MLIFHQIHQKGDKMFNITVDLSVWEVKFQDGSTVEFIDASRAEIIAYFGSNGTGGRGYIKKITRIK